MAEGGGAGNSRNLGGSRFTLFSGLSVLLCLVQIAIIPGGAQANPPVIEQLLFNI